jgi:hypothetical protein
MIKRNRAVPFALCRSEFAIEIKVEKRTKVGDPALNSDFEDETNIPR